MAHGNQLITILYRGAHSGSGSRDINDENMLMLPLQKMPLQDRTTLIYDNIFELIYLASAAYTFLSSASPRPAQTPAHRLQLPE